MANKLVETIKPYIIDVHGVVFNNYIHSYDDIMWDLYTTYKFMNCVYIGKEAKS